jgi:hypothetical protein
MLNNFLPECYASELSKNAIAVYNTVRDKMEYKRLSRITLNDAIVSLRARVILKDLGKAQSELARFQLFEMVPGDGRVTYILPEAEQ